ncbi:hypothetical protein Csa_023797, partial [Cucumis sativus]
RRRRRRCCFPTSASSVNKRLQPFYDFLSFPFLSLLIISNYINYTILKKRKTQIDLYCQQQKVAFEKSNWNFFDLIVDSIFQFIIFTP